MWESGNGVANVPFCSQYAPLCGHPVRVLVTTNQPSTLRTHYPFFFQSLSSGRVFVNAFCFNSHAFPDSAAVWHHSSGDISQCLGSTWLESSSPHLECRNGMWEGGVGGLSSTFDAPQVGAQYASYPTPRRNSCLRRLEAEKEEEEEEEEAMVH
ncbi:unnamed protein product [Mesocestoides corti]|uniref:Uncharacterized protein n=1 Tax=Mesocestoides corti TaxID=53468 RepID=A0A0R3U1T9_MESCO|nr:unnamed protein product [Mesocestoides corti]